MGVTMWIVKTFMHPRHPYLECEYRNSYPSYWLNPKELDIWGSSIPEEIRTYIPIGYVYENT